MDWFTVKQTCLRIKTSIRLQLIAVGLIATVLIAIQAFVLGYHLQGVELSEGAFSPLVFLCFFSFLVAAFIFAANYFLSHVLASKIKALTGHFSKLADGDLSSGPLPEEVWGDADLMVKKINQTSSSLSNVLASLEKAAVLLSTESERASRFAQQTHDSYARQTEENEKLRGVAEQVNTSADSVNSYSISISEVAGHAKEVTKAGRDISMKSWQGTETLVSQMQTASESILQLSEQTNKITPILGIIGEIADQTNLLALNAAIEAARAGEQGRGFAVVADEVRTLAQRSRESALEISEALETMLSDMSKSVETIGKGEELAHETHVLIKENNEGLKEIYNAVELIDSMNTLMVHISEDQSAVAAQMTESLNEYEKLNEQAAAEGEEVTQASNTLKSVSSELSQCSSRYQL